MKRLTNKAISLLLSLIMVMMSASAVFAETEPNLELDATASDAVEFFSSLGVIDKSEVDGENLSRGEFIDLLMAAMNYPYDHVSSAHKFNDVTAEQSWFENVGKAYNLGFISGYTDYTFAPNENILMSHAVTVIRRALNVSSDGVLKDNADFLTMESEFDKVAASVDTSKQYLSDVDALKMLYRMLMIKVTVGVSNLGYTEEDTLLSKLWDAYKVTGKVTATSVTALDSKVGCREGAIEIDGYDYTIAVQNYNDLLGYTVNAYATRDKDGGRGTIISIGKASGKNNSLELNSTMLTEDCFDGKYVYYETDGAKHIKKAKVSSTPAVIYNGVFAGGQVENDLFDITLGEIELIDSDFDGTYDCVKIEDFSTFVANGEATTAQKLMVDYYDQTETVYFEKDGFTNIVEVYFDGVPGTVENILSGDVVNYYQTENGAYRYVKAYVCRETVTGVIKAKSKDTITIGDREIRAAKRFHNNALVDKGDNASIGSYGLFRLNYLGEVEIFEKMQKEGEYTGVLIKMFSEDADRETYLIRIYTEGMDMINYEAARNLTINGEKARTYDRAKEILLPTKISEFDANSELLVQLVHYELDEDGRIIKLYTTAGTDAKSPSLDYDFATRTYLTSGGNWYGRDFREFRVNVSTIFYVIPPLDSEGNLLQDDMFVTEMDNLPNTSSVKCAAYNVGEDFYAENVIFIYNYDNTNIGNSPELYLVQNNTVKMNKDNELVRCLTLYHKGVKYIRETESLSLGEELQPGDLINYVIDNEDVVRHISRVYTLSNDMVQQGVIGGGANYRDQNRIIAGYLTAVYGSFGRLTYDKAHSLDQESEVFDTLWQLGSVSIIKFNERTGAVEIINSGDFNEYISRNKGNDYLFVVRDAYGVTNTAFLYELKER